MIPFPGPGDRGRDRPDGRPDRDRPGSCPAPNQDNDQNCKFTGLSTFEQVGPNDYIISCQYRCPRKGLKYAETEIHFFSENPSFLCSATMPESAFSWSGRH